MWEQKQSIKKIYCPVDGQNNFLLRGVLHDEI